MCPSSSQCPLGVNRYRIGLWGHVRSSLGSERDCGHPGLAAYGRTDLKALAFKFAMLSENNGETVECQISDAAMDELAGVKGTESIARQAQFLAMRDAIERLASDIFDEAPRVRGYAVRIFTKHIRR